MFKYMCSHAHILMFYNPISKIKCMIVMNKKLNTILFQWKKAAVENLPVLHSVTAIKRRKKRKVKEKQAKECVISPSVQTASCNLSMDPTYKARSALVFKLTNFSKLSIHLLTTDSGSSQGLHAQAFRKRLSFHSNISHT